MAGPPPPPAAPPRSPPRPSAFNAATGAILLKTPLSAGANAPVAIDGNYVIAGAANALSNGQQPLIIAYKLGGKSKLPDTVR